MLRFFQIKNLSVCFLLIYLFAFGNFEGFAQANKLKSFKILGISVEGNVSADANTIIVNSGLKIGDEIQIPGDQTLNAIRRLWSLNIFSDVQILSEKQLNEGIFILIKVKEYPRFEKVVIEGNDEESTEDLEEKVNLIRGQIITPQKVTSSISKIKKLYEKDGYLNAEVTAKYFTFVNADTSEETISVTWRNKDDFSDEYVLDYPTDDRRYNNLVAKIKDRILLKLEIVENNKVHVNEIRFHGNLAVDDDELKDQMSDTREPSAFWKFWQSSQFDFNDYKKDKEELIKYYQKNGFRDAEILSDSVLFSDDKELVDIVINLYEGPQYKIRNFIWEGNTIYPDDFLTSRLELNKGDIYNYEKLQQNLRGNEQQTDISSLYLDNGYLMFNLKTIEKKVAEDSVDIIIRVDEKNRFKIGNVDIVGNDKTMDKVIRRELYSVPGDYFNRAFLLRSVQQLANLKYFNVEKLYGPQGIGTSIANDSTVNITFNVEEKSSDFLNASVGYSGSFGFSGAIGVTLSNFSLSHPFSLGGGQIVSFNWQFGVGNTFRTFSLGFTEPWMFGSPTLFGVDIFDTRQQFVYDLQQTGGTIRLGRRLKWPDDFFNVQGTFKYQRNDVINGAGFYAEGKTTQYSIGATISRRNIDNPIFPSQGSSVVLSGELSGGPLLPGNVDFYKFNLSAEWYRRLFNTNRITLYTIADVGYLEELTRGTNIQPFEFFFMGGNGLVIATTPLRGYEDRTVGPKDQIGQVIGGRVKARFTTELRLAVTLEPMPLYLLAFAEAGNVFENLGTTDIFNLRRSAGFGARLLINPIGLIGFDVGYGFDRKQVDGIEPEWLFHFQFGKGF